MLVWLVQHRERKVCGNTTENGDISLCVGSGDETSLVDKTTAIKSVTRERLLW